MEKPHNTSLPGASVQESSRGRIELRPESARRVIEEIPPALVRWGAATIALILLAIIAALCLFPYPYSSGESLLRHFLG